MITVRRAFVSTAFVMGCLISGADAALAEESKSIEIKLSTKGNDIAFDQTAVQIPCCKLIKLKFVNEASKDSEIQHNIAILEPGSTEKVIKDLQKMNYDIEKIRSNKAVLAMTKPLTPGEAGILEFTPKKPGFYPFICLMPGHGDMLNMRGILNIK